jgi:hypothetical protein
MAIVSLLAYCAVDEEERQRVDRAKVVPCGLFQDVIRSSSSIDIVDLTRRADFGEPLIVRTRYFAAVVLFVADVVIVGVRGTRYAYDWKINLGLRRTEIGNGLRLHAGFFREAQALCHELRERLSAVGGRKARYKFLYFTGHSLGGAIAAISTHMELLPGAVACYGFGVPKGGSRGCFMGDAPIWVTRRAGDIVPYCPPDIFGYSDFPVQFQSNGRVYKKKSAAVDRLYFLRWIGELSVRSFLNNHQIERYVDEAVKAARAETRIEKYWDDNVERGWSLAHSGQRH